MNTKRLKLLGWITLLVLISGLLMTACGAADYAGSYDGVAPQESYDRVEYEMAEEMGSGAVGEVAIRRVIRNGSLDLSVRNTRDTVGEIKELVSDAGGMISNSYIYEIREGQYGAHLTIRIPERLFEPIMTQLESYGRATNLQTGIDDVTMHYLDLESRLKNQQAQEARLVEILDMAETVEEVLEVEKELYRVRGEIESMTAQFTQLQDQVNYATINLSLREESIPTENISQNAFENIGERIMQALIGSINFILNAISALIVALIAIIPVLIVIGIFVLITLWLARKIKGRKAVKDTDLNKPADQ